MAAPRKLKVFQAQIGFYDTVVAAPSRPAALRAWGLRQDLFASGHAKVAEDPAAIEAARAHPETPLKRAVGSADPFALDAAHLPDVPDPPAPSKARAPARSRASAKPRAQPEPKPKPKPDRRALSAAEARLGEVEAQRRDEEAEFAQRAAKLAQDISKAKAAYAASHKAAAAAVAKARAAYRKAGGTD
ncbi:hypothetical protein [Phenylobacterium sp.]|uniref:hypothetical protein n=1 Tax=Phenylobacterium sp. TaxID=1871053 RepID=UPI00272FE53B|nr:hypothetical protein [Phenylobacterium sp.]MDP1619268.1 hypothetical protein [Phenylobacterium sp.]MDP1986370.1 hypothetical protein [Phenylobacterium sp.]